MSTITRDLDATPAPSDGPTPRDGWSGLAWAFGLLVVFGALIPIYAAWHYGSLEIPRSDDWSYLLTLFGWVDGGHLDFHHWVSMTLFGQLVVAAPVVAVFGKSIAAVHVFSAFVSLAGLVAVVWLGRTFVRPTWAVFVALTIAIGPLWGAMSATYMTDNWAFAFQIVALALGVEALRRRPLSLGWLTASMAVGLVAFSIRQYAVIPVIAMVLVAVAVAVHAGDRRLLRRVLLVAGLFVIAALALLVLWSVVPNGSAFSPRTPTPKLARGAIRTITGYLRLTGLLLSPVVLLAGPVRIVRRAWRTSRGFSLVIFGIGLWEVFEYVRTPNVTFVNNYVAREGVLAQDVLTGVRPPVIPPGIFDVMVWIAMTSGVVLLLAGVPFLAGIRARLAGRHWYPESPAVALFGFSILGFAMAFALAVVFDIPAFDRYILPVLPLVAFLFLRSVSLRADADATAATPGAAPGSGAPRHAAPTRWLAAIVGAVLLGTVGLAYTFESASWDAARWRAAEQAVALGYSPLQVDAGFEWVAWHRSIGPPWRMRLGYNEEYKILQAFNQPFCVRITSSKNVPTKRIIGSVESTTWSRGPVVLILRKLNKPCVPGAPTPVPALARRYSGAG